MGEGGLVIVLGPAGMAVVIAAYLSEKRRRARRGRPADGGEVGRRPTSPGGPRRSEELGDVDDRGDGGAP